MEPINKLLAKVPVIVLIALYCGYLGVDYYTWMNSANSTLGRKRASLKTSRQDLEVAKKKLVSAEEFFKNLDTLRLTIRQLTAQLEGTKSTITSEIDISKFIRMVTLEAKKVKLVIMGIKPGGEVKKDLYGEVPFTLHVKGAYAQLMVFFDHISRLQQVVKVSDFTMKPTSNVLTKYVELDGTVQLVTYKYLGTHADEVVAKPEMKGSK